MPLFLLFLYISVFFTEAHVHINKISSVFSWFRFQKLQKFESSPKKRELKWKGLADWGVFSLESPPPISKPNSSVSFEKETCNWSWKETGSSRRGRPGMACRLLRGIWAESGFPSLQFVENHLLCLGADGQSHFLSEVEGHIITSHGTFTVGWPVFFTDLEGSRRGLLVIFSGTWWVH